MYDKKIVKCDVTWL